MSSTNLYMTAGETKTIQATVTDGGSIVNISSGYRIDLHSVRGDDGDALVIDKSTTASGDDLVDVTSQGASGIALASFVVSDTSSLAPGDYLTQWRVENTTTGAVKIQKFSITIQRGLF